MNVQKRVTEHALYVDATVKNHTRFFTALQGSQNYGLHDEFSDVDTKSLMVPTFESLVFARKRLSQTLEVAPTVEHADVKDVREMFSCFLKQNVNFLEILFTPYVDVPKEYEHLYQRLYTMRESIAHYNPYQALRTMCGMAYEKYHAFNHPYPSAMEKLEQFGYDPKQLSHMLRMKDFVFRYVNGESYEACLVPSDPDYLLAVKRGLHPLAKAQEVREETKLWVDNFLKEQKNLVSNKEDVGVARKLDELTYELFTSCYQTKNMY